MFQVKGTAHAKSLRLEGNIRRKEGDEDRKGKGNEGCFLQGLVSFGCF